ncbi:zinc finger protein [Nephila pilipes]|uniref:Zinc finger protein n=1 Tax=Nephila pilipes TaxID=299642 RepID=A0A8X6QRX2_NEPPI|nr:zinc finger protein [Nephila pilipes]
MTVSRATTLLFSFRSKIEEAVSLVPRMRPEAKLKAVQFWNIVSEKLQDIVNNSAADISAVALKMDEEDECTDKLNMELNNSSNYIVPQNNEPTPDFMNIPPSYTLYSESSSQAHNTDISNTDLKLLPSESVPSNTEEHHDSSEISDVSQDHHMSIITNVPNNENQQNMDNFLEIANVHSVSEMSNVELRTCNSATKILQNDGRDINCGQYVGNEEQNFNEADCSNEKSSDSSSSRRSSARLKELKKKIDFKSFMDCSDDSYGGNASDIDSTFCLEDSNEHTAERIVRCVSNIRKLLEPNGDSRLQENNENKMQEDSEELSNSDIKASFSCKICNKQFSDSESLANHNSLHDKPYTCTDCQATFASKGNLSVHMRKHTGEKPYCCDGCSARFSTQGNLKRHLKTHTGEKPWKCEQCSSCFTEKKSLIVHMRRHTGERPYQCKMCGKGFAQTGILQTHMAMHLNIKVHLCELCGKSFRQKSQLRIHKLRHDNVRKYGCNSCTAFFLTKGDLERHIRQHTGEKPFVCDVCKKTFTRQQSLNEHLNRHYGIKPYACKHCGKTFVEMSACYKHIKLHTNPGNIEGWRKSALKINHMDQISQPEVTSVARNTENELSNQETPQYFAVVLNPKDACVENNQAILFNPTSNENNIITNGLGVLTAINVLANTSSASETF